MTEPTPGYEFPKSAQDRIEETLRSVNTVPTQPRSVRSSRPGSSPVITPTLESEVPRQAEEPKTLPNTPVSPTPTITSEYVSIDLPSKFAYYPFKDLYIKPFRVPHLSKLAKADAQSSMQLIAETVGSVLMTPDGTPDVVLRLSSADLTYVMMWLRLNSFTKKTINATSICQNEQHHLDVRAGKRSKESLTVYTRVDESNMVIKTLDSIPNPDLYCIRFDDSDKVLGMRPETVADAIQLLDDPRLFDEDFQYLARIASVLDLENFMPEREWTFAEKVRFVETALSPDDVLLAQEFSKLVECGVQESIKTRCGECGASGVAELSFDARSFLSPDF